MCFEVFFKISYNSFLFSDFFLYDCYIGSGTTQGFNDVRKYGSKLKKST